MKTCFVGNLRQFLATETKYQISSFGENERSLKLLDQVSSVKAARRFIEMIDLCAFQSSMVRRNEKREC